MTKETIESVMIKKRHEWIADVIKRNVPPWRLWLRRKLGLGDGIDVYIIMASDGTSTVHIYNHKRELIAERFEGITRKPKKAKRK